MAGKKHQTQESIVRLQLPPADPVTEPARPDREVQRHPLSIQNRKAAGRDGFIQRTITKQEADVLQLSLFC